MFISSKITDYIVTLGNNAKSVQILSDKADEISKHIMEKLQRGVTGIYCKGMYSQSEKLMLMCTVSPKELPKLIRAVRAIDKSAFINCTSLKTISIPQSVEMLAANCFSRCTSLENVVLQNQTLQIDKAAFVDCKKKVQLKSNFAA